MDYIPSPCFLGQFLTLLIPFLLHLSQGALVPPHKNITVPAVYVFGDSIVDTGNNNYLFSVAKCNFPPYGRDFMGGKATGRCSNGRLPSDLLASKLGIKETLPAYLDPNLQPEDLVTGISFASSSTGYDPLTAKVSSVLSLSDQLKLFKEYKDKVKTLVGEERSATIISQSLYVVCAGSNDFLITYFTTPLRRKKYDVPAYTDLMLRSASSFLQKLYGLGARRIAVFSIPAVGCVPAARFIFGGGQGGCVKSVNQAGEIFNAKLYSKLDSLNNKFPQARMAYIDVYFPFLRLNQKPHD